MYKNYNPGNKLFVNHVVNFLVDNLKYKKPVLGSEVFSFLE